MTRTAHTATQLAAALGWTGRQLDEARTLRLLPDPDVSRPSSLGPRWSPRVVAGLVKRRDPLTADLDMGTLGVHRLAKMMTERLGIDVTAAVVHELSRMGHIPRVGQYKGHPTYAVWTAARFDDPPALEQARASGRLHNAVRVSGILQVRRVDVDQLVELGWLRSVAMAENPAARRHGEALIPLYRRGDLAALLAYEAIDWPAVRAKTAGTRSLIARLGRCTPTGRADLEQISRTLIHHRLGHRYWAAGNTAAALDSWRAATGHAEAEQHLDDAGAGHHTSVERCAAWMALLPPDHADLA